MSIFGPQFNRRIEPIDEHPDQNPEKRRQARHRGRIWNQKEKGDVQPTLPTYQETKKNSTIPSYVEGASALFDELMTLEEKVAQLCFYQTESVYDTSIQQHVELLIQAWQIGGLLFTKGQYRRQAYLIERYQELSKTPLLIGNDFLHGLSFYFGETCSFEDVYPNNLKNWNLDDAKALAVAQARELPRHPNSNSSDCLGIKQPGLEKRFLDLGKAVMGLNRRLSVHFQYDRKKKDLPISKEQIHAFRKGVRQAQGIVGYEVASKANPGGSLSMKTSLPYFGEQKIFFSLQNVQEFVSLKSLNFLDFTQDPLTEERLVRAFKEPVDLFLFGSNIQDAILMICRAVKMGRILESELDKRVMKLLALKTQILL